MGMFEINVTLDCNLHCPYCAMKERLNQPLNFSSVLDKLRGVNDSSCCLSGGEPGLLSKEQIQQIIDIARENNISLSLNTNGLFFKHREFLREFSRFNVHVTPFLSKVEIPEGLKLNFVYIVTPQNYHRTDLIEKLVEKYGKLDLIPSSHYNHEINRFTLTRSLRPLFKYMTTESVYKYLRNNRYNITYLN